MIPLRALPWGWIGRIVGGLVLAALLAWIFVVFKAWHDDSQALPGVRAQRDAALAETARVRSDLANEVSRLTTVNEGLIREKNELERARAAVPVRPVRLCRSAPAGAARPPDPAAPGGGDAAPAGTGVLPPEGGWDSAAGPDVGPDLYALFDEADELLRRYRGLQEYVTGLPAACTLTPP